MSFIGKVCLCFCLLGCSKPLKIQSISESIDPALGQVTGEAFISSKATAKQIDPLPFSVPIGLGLVAVSMFIVYKWTLPRSRESTS